MFCRKFSFILFLSLCCQAAAFASALVGAPNDPAIGGGKYYVDLDGGNRFTTGDYVVDDITGLKNALANAEFGEVIFISGNVTIDLSSETSALSIPAGVTLASDRGVNDSKGALLITTVINANQPTLTVSGDGVRITGFRLQGPSPLNKASSSPRSYGIDALDVQDLKIDNMELFNWAFAAIRLRGTTEADIYNSSIHHNDHENLGYGVVLYGTANADIYNNLFNNNRHSIAGDGYPGQIYQAYNNIVLTNANGPAFDMHGYFETSTGNENNRTAGDWVNIYNNTFLLASSAISIRGEPTDGVVVNNNKFAHAEESDAIVQKVLNVVQNPYLNFNISGNSYLQSGDMLYGDFEQSDNRSNDVFWVMPRNDGSGYNDWYVSYDGTQPWKHLQSSVLPITQMSIGDFYGDGIDDVFKTSSGNWHVSNDAQSSWQVLNTSAITIENLEFADVDNDGKTDVINNNRVSLGGNTSWDYTFLDTAISSAELWLDMNNDGQDDAIKAVANQLEVSWGGQNSFQVLAGNETYTDVGYGQGDFDSDGNIDQFRVSGINNENWEVRYHGQSNFSLLSSGHTQAFDQLAFGDFNGDGITDVFTIVGSAWRVSWGGLTNWVTINHSTIELSKLYFADFNGDGITDAAKLQNGANGTIIVVSLEASQTWRKWTAD